MRKSISFSLAVTYSQTIFPLTPAKRNFIWKYSGYFFLLLLLLRFVSFIKSKFLFFGIFCLIFMWIFFSGTFFSWTTKWWCITLRSFRMTKTTPFGPIPGRCTRQKTQPCSLVRRRSNLIRVGSIGIKEETFTEPGRVRVMPSKWVTRTSRNHQRPTAPSQRVVGFTIRSERSASAAAETDSRRRSRRSTRRRS